MMFKSVVFPEPDGPDSAVTARSGNAKDTPLSTGALSNAFEMPSSATTIAPPFCGAAP